MKEQRRADEEKIYQSKPATLLRAKKAKRPIKDSKEPVLEMDIGKRDTKLTWNKPEGAIQSSPLQDVSLLKASSPKAGKDIKNQTELSSKMLENTEPGVTLLGKTKTMSGSTAPEKELTKDLPKLGESTFSENEAFLPLGLMEPFSSNQGNSSASPNDVQAVSTGLKLDRIDPAGQKLLVELPDMPNSDYHNSPTNLDYGTERVETSLSSSERDSKAKEQISEVTDTRDSESPEKNMESQILGFRVKPVDKTQVKETQVKEFDLEAEVLRSKRNVEKAIPMTEMKEWTSIRGDSKNFLSSVTATVKNSQDECPNLNLVIPKEITCNEFLSISQSHDQNLVSLTLNCLQEEKAEVFSHDQVRAVKEMMKRQGLASFKPRSACQSQASHPMYQQSLYPTWHHSFKTPFTYQITIADKTTSPSSLGLEWFPELYPAYRGLGVLPGKPQYWNVMTQKSLLISPQGETLSEVPLLERSLTALRNLEPPTRLTISNSLLTFLGAVQKGWIKYRTTVKSGVGGITMLFTGYFILCCNWSFRHLKLQRWRK